MENVENTILDRALQIDQHIAARDQSDPRERRVAQHAVIREQYDITQFSLHLIMISLWGEETFQPFRAYIRLDR